MRNLLNNINKKDYIFYKNFCITNKKNKELSKLYINNLNLQNNKNNKNNKNNNESIFSNVNENVSELQYLEQIYDCIEHNEKLYKKIDIKN